MRGEKFVPYEFQTSESEVSPHAWRKGNDSIIDTDNDRGISTCVEKRRSVYAEISTFCTQKL